MKGVFPLLMWAGRVTGRERKSVYKFSFFLLPGPPSSHFGKRIVTPGRSDMRVDVPQQFRDI